MKKLFIFSLITSSIITLIACNNKDSTVNLKQAKTTREAIQAISGLEYRLVKVLPVYRNIKATDSSYVKFLDLDNKDINESENAIVGGKIAVAGMISNIQGLANKDPNRPLKYIDKYFNIETQNKVNLAYSSSYIEFGKDTLRLVTIDSYHATIYSLVASKNKNESR
jgi:hypothetical protein